MAIRSSISAATALSGLILVAAGPAHALPGAESFDSISLVFRQAVTLSGIGPGAADVLNDSASPDCGGVCSTTTTLGANPSIKLQLDQVKVPGVIPGNFELGELAYFIEANGPAGTPVGTPIASELHASQDFSSQFFGDDIEAAGGEAQVAIFFGASSTEPNFAQQNAGVAPYPSQYQDTYCISYCVSSFANYKNPEPIPAAAPVMMESGVPYLVEIVDELTANPNVSPHGNQLSSTIDPFFTTSTPGVTFSYSPGVSGAVPEPASWAMMMFGVALVGGVLRTAPGRRRPAVAQA